MKFILMILISLNANALKTVYEWRLTRADQLDSGKCFEVDNEKYGKKYQNIVDKELCRPRSTLMAFNYQIGRCFEIDAETLGKQYYKKVKLRNCKPEKTKYHITSIRNRERCYEVDARTLGKEYYKKVKNDLCLKDYKLVWEQVTKVKGRCYKIPEEGGVNFKIRTDEEECRPPSPEYVFIREDSFNGDCVASDPKDSKLYFHKTKIENCRPQNTLYIFYSKDKVSKGKCYEVDAETKGDKYLNRVDIERCKDS